MSIPDDPFSVPMIFLRVGWMDRYSGTAGGDSISKGGAYIGEHGFGHEIFNFRPFRGRVYGYVQPPGRRGRWTESRINLRRLRANAGVDSVSGVLAVWVATAPTGGGFVVGWYRNATVHRFWQPAPPDSERHHSDAECGYYVTARSEDATLLADEERLFSIPQKGRGAFGQANVWYADESELHRQIRTDLLRFVETRRLVAPADIRILHQADLLLRQRVEEVAIQTTADYFAGLGYRVESVEQDNVGWDLNATSGRRELKLEVKGLSGLYVVVELTPNEYAAMREHLGTYRVCVVTDALAAPRLSVFAYSPELQRWEDGAGRVLDIREVVSARCSAAHDA